IVVGDGPVTVHTGVFPEDVALCQGVEEVSFEIFCSPNDYGASKDGTESAIYCQGTAVFVTAREVPALDIKAIQAVCNQYTLSHDEVYDAFKAMGINYGPGHQGIEMIY